MKFVRSSIKSSLYQSKEVSVGRDKVKKNLVNVVLALCEANTTIDQSWREYSRLPEKDPSVFLLLREDESRPFENAAMYCRCCKKK